jgi:Domain of unknown function (DUF4430)
LTGSRATAVAIALGICSALAAAGCGLGPGESVGEADLTVTRDYGTEPVVGPTTDDVAESDTVMRLLERNAEIETRFGGGFVHSIEGLEGAEEVSGEPEDWFFYVNGVESTVGAADFPLRGGEQVWWDYRDWGAAMRVPAVVGSWPQPFLDGYEGRPRPVVVECAGAAVQAACEEVEERLEAEGASLGAAGKGVLRVLVGEWAQLRDDPAAAAVEEGPEAGGVFADFEISADGCRLAGLDEGGRPAETLAAGAGLVAATRRYGSPPVWLVTGCDPDGVAAAAGLLDGTELRNRYAVATAGGESLPLPIAEGMRRP